MNLVLHAADGIIQYEALGFVGADAARMALLYVAMWWVAVLGVVVFDWGAWRLRRPVAPAPVRAVPDVS
jgi:hypothetical protein